MDKIKKFINKILRREKPEKKIEIDLNAHTIPEGFGYPEENFHKLVNELMKYINVDDSLVSLDSFLNGALIEKYNLDMSQPRYAAIFGYAFCTAVISLRTTQKQTAINQVLREFHPTSVPINSRKSVN